MLAYAVIMETSFTLGNKLFFSIISYLENILTSVVNINPIIKVIHRKLRIKDSAVNYLPECWYTLEETYFLCLR